MREVNIWSSTGAPTTHLFSQPSSLRNALTFPHTEVVLRSFVSPKTQDIGFAAGIYSVEAGDFVKHHIHGMPWQPIPQGMTHSQIWTVLGLKSLFTSISWLHI